MLVIPIQTKGHLGDILVLVLHKDDWLKMRQADPLQLNWSQMVKELGKDVYHPTMIICYEDDLMPLMKLLDKKDIIGALRYLQRGIKPTDNPIQAAVDRLGLSDGDY